MCKTTVKNTTKVLPNENSLNDNNIFEIEISSCDFGVEESIEQYSQPGLPIGLADFRSLNLLLRKK